MRPRPVLSPRPGPRTAGDRMVAGDRLPDLSPHAPGRPRHAGIGGIRTPPGYSDTTPAIWNGNVAFARHRSAPRSTRLYIWHRSDRSTTLLGGGQRSCGRERCAHREAGSARRGSTRSTSMRRRPATNGSPRRRTECAGAARPNRRSAWTPSATGCRADSRKSSRAHFSGAPAGAGTWDPPSLAGEHVLYERNLFECERAADEEISNRFVWFLEEHVEKQAPAPGYGVAVALAWDRGTAYSIAISLAEYHCRGPGHPVL